MWLVTLFWGTSFLVTFLRLGFEYFFFVSKLENKQKIQAGYFAFSTWFAVCVLGRTIPVCVRIRFLPRLPSATSTKFISIRSGFASVFLQFRAMNSNFDVLVLSIFLGNTKFMKVSSIVPIGVLACFKYLILNFTCREVAGLNNYPGGFKLLKTINQTKIMIDFRILVSL